MGQDLPAKKMARSGTSSNLAAWLTLVVDHAVQSWRQRVHGDSSWWNHGVHHAETDLTKHGQSCFWPCFVAQWVGWLWLRDRVWRQDPLQGDSGWRIPTTPLIIPVGLTVPPVGSGHLQLVPADTFVNPKALGLVAPRESSSYAMTGQTTLVSRSFVSSIMRIPISALLQWGLMRDEVFFVSHVLLN